jgi:MFS superfamily sulfate permease-like transporter
MTDLIVGVPVGMVAAFLYFVREMSRLNVELVSLPEPPADGSERAEAGCPAVAVMRVEGPLFFASGFHLRHMVTRLNGHRCVILDLGAVPFLDVTGAEILEESVEDLHRRGVAVVLALPTPPVQRRLESLARTRLHALPECPVSTNLRDAMLLAQHLIDRAHLCQRCRTEDQCLALKTTLKEMKERVRAPGPDASAMLNSAAGDGWKL